MTKTPSHTRCWTDFVLNFEYSDFDIVSDFGFRYSDFHKLCGRYNRSIMIEYFRMNIQSSIPALPGQGLAVQYECQRDRTL